MKRINNLNKHYKIVPGGDNDIYLLCKSKPSTLLGQIMNDLEEKIIEFTTEIELKLNDLYELNRSVCSNLYSKVSKIQTVADSDVDSLADTLNDIIELKDSSTVQLNDIAAHISKSLSQRFDSEIEFLYFSSAMARDIGEIKESAKIQELTIKRLNQLGNIVKDICISTEAKINELHHSLLTFIYNHLGGIDPRKDCDQDTDNTEKDINTINVPRTSLKLKRHLKDQGFELDRTNGSHQIYKNDDGEIRVLPARRGNHVLAPKTAKNIYNGFTPSEIQL